MAHIDVFLRMLNAYKQELGAAFPKAAPESVLLVLRECNRPRPRPQKQVEDATRLPQPTVSKLIAKMVDREWLERSERDPATSVKPVQISLLGQGVLEAFEKACRDAARNVPKGKGSDS
jgi:DNA-binding MarR family transcriptional regulator